MFGGSFKKELAKWNLHKKKWNEGMIDDYKGGWIPKEEYMLAYSYNDWNGKKPIKEDYMPDWSDNEKTHIQLYENTSEGTPITPVFKKKDFEKLCEYAANNATTFGYYKATKEQWMEMLKNDFVSYSEGNVMFI